MTKSNQLLKMDFGVVDYFPAVLDYDFVKNRPRGGSCRVDFFSYGRLSEVLNNMTPLPNVFVKLSNIFFKNGIFLVDYSLISKRCDHIVDMVKKLHFSKIYIEDSRRFSVAKLIEKLNFTEVILMSFYS